LEKDANYTVVGALCLALLFGLAVFVIWLAKFQFSKTYDLYDIQFQGPVHGLSRGGEVHFNGIKVGEVTGVMLDPRDPSHVIAHTRLDAGVPVKRDSYATLEAQGITGVSYVQIAAGSPKAPLLKSVAPPGQTPLLYSRRGALDSLLAGGDSAVTQLVAALGRVNRVLSDENIAAFSGTLADVHQVTDELAARKALIADTQTTIRHIDAAAEQMAALGKSGQALLDGDAPRTLKNISEAAEQTKAAAQQARTLLARLDGPTSDFAADGLPQVTAAFVDLQRTSETLDQALNEVRADPRAILSKPSPRELEVQK